MHTHINPMLRRLRRHGFTLLEVILVLALLTAVTALFLPMLSNAGPTGTANQAQATVSRATNAIYDVHETDGGLGLAACSTSLTTGVCDLTGKVHNVTPTTGASTNASTASIAAQLSGDTWTVAVTTAETPKAGFQPGICHTIVTRLPGGVETYFATAPAAGGCSAAAMLTLTPTGCPSGNGTSWIQACASVPRP